MSSAPSSALLGVHCTPFTRVDFYDYKIRMCVIDGTKMYLVSDLLRQYNEKNGTNKKFDDYLESEDTQEVIKHMGKRDQTVRVPNSDPHFQMFLNDEKWNIPRVIQYITISSSVGANKEYVICEELPHACLIWADPDFAWNIFSFMCNKTMHI